MVFRAMLLPSPKKAGRAGAPAPKPGAPARPEEHNVKRIHGMAALLLLCGAVSARAQDAPPPPPPEADGTVAVEAPALPPAAPDMAGEDADLRAQLNALREQVRILQQRLDQMQNAAPGAEPPPPAEGAGEIAPPAEAAGELAPPAEAATTQTAGAGRALLLPDISFIGTAGAHVSTDRRDEDRSRIFLDSAEIGIQGYVYPGVKADAFLAADRDNDFNLQVEEAYLSVLNLAKNTSLQVGKRKVPFGRVNQLHPHSWLYITQPYALANLVAEESLTGQGATLSYLIPTKGSLFAQLDAGLWNGAEHGEIQPADTDEIRAGPGAAFQDRFQTLRLWTGTSVGANGELELGLSGAHGKGQAYEIVPGAEARPETTLTGLDFSYRHFGRGTSRTLLRAEYVRHRSTSSLGNDTAQGYYVLADHRLDPYREIGLRYDWSEFPYAPGLHESGLSAILTRQLTEQTYLRLQLTRAARPGDSGVNEAWLQWVWGVGPHTHNLE